MFIRDSVFEASRGLGPDADLQVVRYFEKSEMDKQAVTEKIKSKMNDHYKLTSSICGLRYFTREVFHRYVPLTTKQWKQALLKMIQT